MENFGKGCAWFCKKSDPNIGFLFAKYFKIAQKQSDMFPSRFLRDEWQFLKF